MIDCAKPLLLEAGMFGNDMKLNLLCELSTLLSIIVTTTLFRRANFAKFLSNTEEHHGLEV